MFSKKQLKKHSTAKLIKILTKRSSNRNLNIKNGIYVNWPSQQKPSILNCSTNYIRYLGNYIKQQTEQANKQNVQKMKHARNRQLVRIPATYSTSSTMHFQKPSQESLLYTRQKSKPQKQRTVSVVPSQTPTNYTRKQSASNIPSQQQEEGQLLSKYLQPPKKIKMKKTNIEQNRRTIKTAKINRRKIQEEEPNTQNFKYYMSQPQSSYSSQCPSKRTSRHNSKLITPKPQTKEEPELTLNTFTANNSSSESLRWNHNNEYPMRLKDYQTNFYAYKTISKLMDKQMNWGLKRMRPKSSVTFRKYNLSIKR